MKKKLIFPVFFAFVFINGYAQPKENIDSLKHELSFETKDTSRVIILYNLCGAYWNYLPDSALKFGQQALDLARQINFPKGEASALVYLGLAHSHVGNSPKGLELLLKALQIAETSNLNAESKAEILYSTGYVFQLANDYKKGLSYMHQALNLFDSLDNNFFKPFVETDMARTFLEMNQLDSAIQYGKLAYQNMILFKKEDGYTLNALGLIYTKKRDSKLAIDYFRQSLAATIKENNYRYISEAYFGIAKVYQQINKPDSCVYYAQKTLEEAQKGTFYSTIIDASTLLASLYEQKDWEKVFQYNKITIAAKDSLYNLGKRDAFNDITNFDKNERQYEIKTAQTAYQNKVRQNALLAGLGVFLLIAFILYRNNRQKRKANKILAQQKEQVETTLLKLKSTQAQLIQSEKMASLGELTAGIAHEIQNPLNFVNNFSDVNKELLEEMKDEMNKGNLDDANSIANDVIENSEKINHHGKRAGDIVKGMLQHSRTSTGVKEPTDINALADEYLRLAYHARLNDAVGQGLRAKEKTFNATMKTDFDDSIGKINIIPQDIGRVLLNLYNNAFYAVSERQKAGGKEYEPTVSVTTKKSVNHVIITVSDNGNGIPQKIVDKIFQPFFTTKPTGQGTGLGLSLSYDIVKAHGGEIKVETKEGEAHPDNPAGQGSEFIIQLPIK